MPDDPDLPAHLTEAQRARCATVAAQARRTADRVPHSADEFREPAHVFDLHHAGLRRPVR